MKITIRLRYRTRVGQQLFLRGNHSCLAGPDGGALAMHYADAQHWEVIIDLSKEAARQTPVNYYFILRQPDGSVLEDFGGDRSLDFSSLPAGDSIVLESWNDMEAIANVFFTQPFQKVLLGPAETSAVKTPPGATHFFHVKAPLLPAGQTLCLLGNSSKLGNWQTNAPILLQRDATRGSFGIALDLAAETLPIAYKFGVYDLKKSVFLCYEDDENRTLSVAASPRGRVIINDGFARLPFTLWHGAGVAVPVFSLRTEQSFGVGEFLDLAPLAAWARRAGLKMIQILPVNDTIATHTWTDSYPYASISSFALHPVYLNLDRLIGREDKHLLNSLAAKREKLNLLPALDYEPVMEAKLEFIRQVFSAQHSRVFASPAYKEYFSQNRDWLVPYAAFCYLRDKFGTADFGKWPEHHVYDEKKITALAAQNPAAQDEMDLHCFIQFHLDLQLREAIDAIHAEGLILKGDIAIGVSRASADVWQQPELFDTGMQAGAPPDAFAVKGQNWSFPTYNWPRMKEDGYIWWKRRLVQMGRYFDAFRIDHILGFFRIWSIPRTAVEGILGFFVPALPVRLADFSARGLVFNYERFVKPFINDAVLRKIFGDQADAVKGQFLDAGRSGQYTLKPQFATQRDVENYFASRPADDSALRLKIGLFDLISNVLLLEAPGKGGEYHFRFGMENTESFHALDSTARRQLKEWCDDYFYRNQDEFWKCEALEKLPMLKRVTNMLICGEDLGMVPRCVPDVMRQLALLGLEVQRMPKGMGRDFSRPAEASYLSVVTPGTHDMSTVRGWWREDRAITQEFFKSELGHSGHAPAECTPDICREIIRQHLESPAMWSVFQLQDLFALDEALWREDVDAERINIPANPNHFWRYRMHITVEELGRAENLATLLSNHIRQSGR